MDLIRYNIAVSLKISFHRSSMIEDFETQSQIIPLVFNVYSIMHEDKMIYRESVSCESQKGSRICIFLL